MKKFILLSFTLSLAIFTNAQVCSELFISEYLEGSHNNKALELYNPTDTDIILDGSYDIVRYSNGADESIEDDIQYVQPLTGTVPAYSTYIALLDQQDVNGTGMDTILFADLLTIGLTNSNADFYSPDYESGTAGCRVMAFNGDDALGLRINGVKVDIFGKIGEDPGYAWTNDPSAGFTDGNNGTWLTRDHTLIRKPSIKIGVGNSPVLFDALAEWDTLSKNTFTELGQHACDCDISAVNELDNRFRAYPNPANFGQTVVLQSDKNIQSIIITNLLGKTIRTYQTNQKVVFLQTQNLGKGIYIVSIRSNGKTWEEQLIVQ